MSNILRYTKEVYKSFKEDNGRYKLDSSSMLAKRKLGDKTNSFLADYVEFVMNSNIISDVTKAYIESIETKVSDVVAAYNLNNPYKQITSKQLHNHLYYDEKRLCNLFSDDMIMNIIYKKADISLYETMLASAKSKKANKSLLAKQCVLELPTLICNEVPSKEDTDSFFVLYTPYARKIAQAMIESLPANVIGYFNYLSNKKNLTPDEKAYLARLEQLDEGLVIE